CAPSYAPVVQRCLLQIPRAPKSSCWQHVMRCLVVSTVTEHRFARNKGLAAAELLHQGVSSQGYWDSVLSLYPMRPAVNHIFRWSQCSRFQTGSRSLDLNNTRCVLPRTGSILM